MLGCYLDESFDPNDSGVFAVGGVIGRGRPLFELDRKWQALRKRSDIDIEYFKASECQRGSGQFQKFCKLPKQPDSAERKNLDAMWNEFLTLMLGDPGQPGQGEAVALFGVGVIQNDFYDLIKREQRALEVLGDSPFMFAYHAAMIEAACAMKWMNTGQCVSFVVDRNEQYSVLAHAAYRRLMAKNPQTAEYMGAYMEEDDKNCGPLQAADAAVYEIRRYLNLVYEQFPGDVRWQYRKLEERMWMIQTADKQFLENYVAEVKPGEPFDLDHFCKQEFPHDIKPL